MWSQICKNNLKTSRKVLLSTVCVLQRENSRFKRRGRRKWWRAGGSRLFYQVVFGSPLLTGKICINSIFSGGLQPVCKLWVWWRVHLFYFLQTIKTNLYFCWLASNLVSLCWIYPFEIYFILVWNYQFYIIKTKIDIPKRKIVKSIRELIQEKALFKFESNH